MILKIIKMVFDFVNDVGFGVIKNSLKMIWGGCQVVVGIVTFTDELVGKGIKNIAKGVIGFLSSLGFKHVCKLFPICSEDDSGDFSE